MNAKHVTEKQLAALKAEALTLLLTAPMYAGCTVEAAREHVEFGFVSQRYNRNLQASAYLNAVVTAFSQNVSIPPSLESLAWAGMEGGHVLWNSRKAEQIARELAAKCGIELKN